MSSTPLRNRLIRIAHANPELRKDLLPLLASETVDTSQRPRTPSAPSPKLAAAAEEVRRALSDALVNPRVLKIFPTTFVDVVNVDRKKFKTIVYGVVFRIDGMEVPERFSRKDTLEMRPTKFQLVMRESAVGNGTIFYSTSEFFKLAPKGGLGTIYRGSDEIQYWFRSFYRGWSGLKP